MNPVTVGSPRPSGACRGTTAWRTSAASMTTVVRAAPRPRVGGSSSPCYAAHRARSSADPASVDDRPSRRMEDRLARALLACLRYRNFAPARIEPLQLGWPAAELARATAQNSITLTKPGRRSGSLADSIWDCVPREGGSVLNLGAADLEQVSASNEVHHHPTRELPRLPSWSVPPSHSCVGDAPSRRSGESVSTSLMTLVVATGDALEAHSLPQKMRRSLAV